MQREGTKKIPCKWFHAPGGTCSKGTSCPFKHGDLPVQVPPVPPVPVPVPHASPVSAALVVPEGAVQLSLNHLERLAESAEMDPSPMSSCDLVVLGQSAETDLSLTSSGDLVVLDVPEDPDRSRRSRRQSNTSPAGAEPQIDDDWVQVR
jgi:hypothetical protein